MQIHDNNPGDLNVPGEPDWFIDGGVFWTKRVPESSVKIHPGRGDARFTLSDTDMLDYITVVNAILRTGPDPVPVKASVDIHWMGTGERMKVNNEEAGFSGQYENATAEIVWSVHNADYAYSTANSSETHIAHAFTAKVRNGAFHP